MRLSQKTQINNSQTSPSRKSPSSNSPSSISPSSKSSSPGRKSPSSNFSRHCRKNIEDLLGDDDKKNVSPKKDQKQAPQKQQLQKQKQKQKQKQPSGSSPVSTKQRQSIFVFNRVTFANQFTRSIASTTRQRPVVNEKTRKSETLIKVPDKRIVVYMTSLGAVRPTFDACRAVRSILQGFRVVVEERDLSMDASFKDELRKIMIQIGQENKVGGLPRVFIGGRYVGDADDMRQMNETGELKKLIEGLPAVSRGVCESCGDFRFLICTDCYGSRKCFIQKGGFRICMICNKNGLIRCPICCIVKS